MVEYKRIWVLQSLPWPFFCPPAFQFLVIWPQAANSPVYTVNLSGVPCH